MVKPAAGADTSNARIRVLIADDHAILRRALRMMLETEPLLQVVGEAENGREAVAMAARVLPDVVLMDMVMPGLNGVDATRQLLKAHPDCKVLMVSAYGDDERVVHALQAGAAGYVLKDSDLSELVRAIRAVHGGTRYFSSPIASDLPVAVGGRTAGVALTGREREVLQLIAEGHSNHGIADELLLSVKTVEVHRANLMAKLGAENSADLVRHAMAEGVLGLEPRPELADAAPDAD
jgi:DNA-binding NarL/FixJ family response regulator